MENNRKKKIQELMRKNRRKDILEKIDSSFTTTATIGFIEFSKNDEFVKAVFRKISNIEVTKNFSITTLEQLKIDTINLMKIYIPLMKYVGDFHILYFGKYEIESMIVQSLDVIKNYSYLLDVIGYSDGRADLVIVTDDLDKGLVVERTEYKYEVKIWGVL